MKKLLLIAASLVLLICSTASEVKAFWGRPYRYGYYGRPWGYRSWRYRPWRGYRYRPYGYYGYPYGYYGWGRPSFGFSIGF